MQGGQGEAQPMRAEHRSFYVRSHPFPLACPFPPCSPQADERERAPIRTAEELSRRRSVPSLQNLESSSASCGQLVPISWEGAPSDHWLWGDHEGHGSVESEVSLKGQVYSQGIYRIRCNLQ